MNDREGIEMRFTGFMLVLIGTATVAAAQTPQTAQTPRGAQTQTTQVGGRQANFTAEGNAALVLEIGARQYGANHQVGGSASNSGATGKVESYVWTSNGLCGMSASTTEPASVPGTGWHFTGEITTSPNNSDQLTVSVSWQRLWNNGVRLADNARSSGSQTITLRAGERIVLDRVLPASQSPCGAVDAQLEAAVVAQPAFRLVFSGRVNEAGGVGRGGRGAMAGPAGQMAAQGQQGARGQQGAQGQLGRQGQQGAQGQQVAQGQQGQQGQLTPGRGGRGTASADATAQAGRVQTMMTAARGQRGYYLAAAAPYDAELWLVHRKPDGTETVQQQTVHFGGGRGTNGAFAFPPIQVPTAKGPITIDITGSLQSSVGSGDRQTLTVVTPPAANETTAQHLTISIDRRARAAGLDITGGSHMVIDVPKPTDVTSFEFPALQKSTEDLLKGHQFSLRLQVKSGSDR
jgi:hypothetical protein